MVRKLEDGEHGSEAPGYFYDQFARHDMIIDSTLAFVRPYVTVDARATVRKLRFDK